MLGYEPAGASSACRRPAPATWACPTWRCSSATWSWRSTTASAARSSCRAATPRPAPARAPTGRARACRRWPGGSARPRSQRRPGRPARDRGDGRPRGLRGRRPAGRGHILAGDIFQANLSQRFTGGPPGGMTPFDLFRRLRARNPAPFAAYLDLGDAAVVARRPSASCAWTAGGWRRGPSRAPAPAGPPPSDDAALAAELPASEKDRAENVMIVDLLRNDLSRVCTTAASRVPRAVRPGALRHRHAPGLARSRASCARARRGGPAARRASRRLHHRGAQDAGDGDHRRARADAARACTAARSAYVGFDGAMDTSIAIRTLRVRGRRASFSAGGGIVADSDPERGVRGDARQGRGR